jgi:hypothetical protein
MLWDSIPFSDLVKNFQGMQRGSLFGVVLFGACELNPSKTLFTACSGITMLATKVHVEGDTAGQGGT